MDKDFDFIVKAHKKYNIFNTTICFVKSIRNNLFKFPWFDITVEHEYKEVSVDKKTSADLYEKGIVIGDGDLICEKCGTISHNMVEHDTIKGHTFCQSKNCAHYHTSFMAKMLLDIDRMVEDFQKYISNK